MRSPSRQIMLHVIFATCTQFPEGAPDDRFLVERMRARGHRVSLRIWNHDRFDDADAVVLRSCWDYHLDSLGFRRWLDSLAERRIRCFNSPTLARWNQDKVYLQELADRGVALPKTAFVPHGTNLSLRHCLEEHQIESAVVKPMVSMGGWETWRTQRIPSEAAEAHFHTLSRTHDLLVQEFAAEVLTEGELSLVYFAGTFSHALRKRPASGEFRIHTEHGGHVAPFEPDAILRACAERAIAAAPEPALYARVDLVPSPRGPLLMELELIDPELFFRLDPAAADRLIDALERAHSAGSS